MRTKGSWRSVYKPGSKQRCAAVESREESVYIFLNIAKDDDMDETIERWKNDAQLIAAAPELLEAVKKAHASLTTAMTGEEFDAVVQQCYAAIQKAEGNL